jgi:hypothetical protein
MSKAFLLAIKYPMVRFSWQKEFLVVVCIFMNFSVNALDPKFSIEEYIATLKMNFCQFGTLHDTMVCKPKEWQRLYRSPVVGMDNRFDIWRRDSDGLIGISMRSTTPRAISWMQNFYTAMIPAKGTLQINDTLIFEYILAERADAAVHVGWTYALGAMHIYLLEQIKKLYNNGSREFLIFGHSQGGALSYLTFAYVHYLKRRSLLPQDLRFKMVASASPKVGNIHFAYDFESYTSSGWAYNVVNPEDWIPLMPISVQTLDDMTATQPFEFIKKGLKTLKFPTRIAISTAYNNINRKTKQARKALQKNLGKRVGKQVRKERTQFKEPQFHHSMNYVRAGNHIVFATSEAYYRRFPKKSDDIFVHHMMEPYLCLAELNRESFEN